MLNAKKNITIFLNKCYLILFSVFKLICLLLKFCFLNNYFKNVYMSIFIQMYNEKYYVF